MPTIAQIVGQDTTQDTATIQHHHSRQTFHAQRKAGLAKQRDHVQARLDNLRKEVRKIQAKAALMDDARQIQDAIGKLERMGRAERKLVEDVARLTGKIGG